jgi:hypothetical protein
VPCSLLLTPSVLVYSCAAPADLLPHQLELNELYPLLHRFESFFAGGARTSLSLERARGRLRAHQPTSPRDLKPSVPGEEIERY